ncbi:MAG: TIM barrel protein [Planctomycetota bacterium]|nr:TIM barrel protein [Planctomycetota bacterium]
MTMLLTLAASSLRKLVSTTGKGSVSLLDLPSFTITQLQLRGLNVPSSMLAGWSLADLDQLRDRGDKAGCPCLVLIEDPPLRFADPLLDVRQAAAERVHRLAVAANRLGCNALAVRSDAPDTDEALELTATELKAVMPGVERLELNLLLAPHAGLTDAPDRLTDLMKRIGGFRIGSLPDFAHAAASGDLVETLRKLAPYAGAVHASVNGFNRRGTHKDYDLAQGVQAIRGVGFVNTLAINYVGDGDPLTNIESARKILQQAIDANERPK